jgi:hypothetical protein
MAVEWKKLAFDADTASLSDTDPLDVFKQTAYEGVAANASRDDHKHDVLTAAPTGAVAESASSTEGTGTALVRSDHIHAAPATWAPTAHEASHKNGGTDEILLHEFGEPTSAVPFDGQQATNFVIENSAATLSPAVLGKIYYDTDDDSVYVCTSIA